MHTAFNPMGVGDMAKDYIIDYGESSDKTQWYRLWKSGWIEQGGNYTGATGSTITLIKSFSNMNYILTYANWSGTCYCYKSTANSIVWHDIKHANNTGISWYTCGY